MISALEMSPFLNTGFDFEQISVAVFKVSDQAIIEIIDFVWIWPFLIIVRPAFSKEKIRMQAAKSPAFTESHSLPKRIGNIYSKFRPFSSQLFLSQTGRPFWLSDCSDPLINSVHLHIKVSLINLCTAFSWVNAPNSDALLWQCTFAEAVRPIGSTFGAVLKARSPNHIDS